MGRLRVSIQNCQMQTVVGHVLAEFAKKSRQTETTDRPGDSGTDGLAGFLSECLPGCLSICLAPAVFRSLLSHGCFISAENKTLAIALLVSN